MQLVELQSRLDDIRRSGLGLAAISYDPVPVLRDFAARRRITFPMLSDAGSRVIREYGILNTTVASTSEQYGIPFPGTFVVDRRGVVTARVFERAYQERDTVASVLVHLGNAIAVDATRVTAPHLTLTAYVTDRIAAPGTHFSIVVDAAPARGTHVYAPGVTGYKPISIRVEPQPGLLVRSAQFPPPIDFFFKPLNEHVKVYAKPFRIVQDVAVDASPDGVRALAGRDQVTIAAAVDYQACDDRVCFTPQTVPLSWTIALKPLDRDRVKRP